MLFMSYVILSYRHSNLICFEKSFLHSLAAKIRRDSETAKGFMEKCFWGPFIYSDLTVNQAELNRQSAPGWL